MGGERRQEGSRFGTCPTTSHILSIAWKQDTNRALWSFPEPPVATVCGHAPRRDEHGRRPNEGSKAAPLQSHGVASDAIYG
jgi:hypothetical protein